MYGPLTQFVQTVDPLYMFIFDLTPVQRSYVDLMISNECANSNSHVFHLIFGLLDQKHGALIKKSKDGQVDIE